MFIYTFSVDLWLRPHYAAGSAGCPMRLTVRAVKSGFRPVLVYAFKDTKMKMIGMVSDTLRYLKDNVQILDKVNTPRCSLR